MDVSTQGELKHLHERVRVLEQELALLQSSTAGTEQEGARYRALFSATQDGLLIVDDTGRYVDVNLAYAQLLKSTPEHVIGRHFSEFIPPERLPEAEAAFSTLRQQGAGLPEFPLRATDGSVVDCEWTVRAHFVPGLSLCSARDMTARKRTEQALRASEARFRFLTQLDDATRSLADPDQIVQTVAGLLARHLDADGVAYCHVDADLKEFEVLGAYTANSALGLSGRYTLDEFGASCGESLRRGTPYVVQDVATDARTADVREAYRRVGIGATLAIPLHKDGRLVAAMGVQQLTARAWDHDQVDLVAQVANRCWESIERARIGRALVEREARLAATNAYLHQVFAQAPVAIVMFRGPDFVVELANPLYQAMLHGRALLGRPFAEVMPELGPAVWDVFHRVLATGEPYVATDWYIPYDANQDGDLEDHWFNVVFQPFREHNGSESRFIAVLTDVTAQVLSRRELERVNRDLEEFAYVASHDLQEPLRMVNIYTQLLTKRYSTAGDQAREYASVIEHGVKRMETLIRDLLTYSRTVQSEDVLADTADLGAALADALAVLAPRITVTAARIRTPDALPRVRGNTQQLSLVFQNLLSNALKYQPRNTTPQVHITAEQRDEQWVISVTDNGIGFDQQYAERIFGLFKRLHNDEYPGTGLGLALAQRIITRHGGTIWAHSTLGHGATFSISLPALERQP